MLFHGVSVRVCAWRLALVKPRFWDGWQLYQKGFSQAHSHSKPCSVIGLRALNLRPVSILTMLAMNSVSDASDDSRSRAGRGKALGLAFALGVGLAAVAGWLFAERGDAMAWWPGVLVLCALMTAVLLLAVLGLGWHLGVRLTRQQLGGSLREARMQVQAMAQLQGDWLWATDAEHHLVRWQAPRAAPASAWVGPSATQVFWDRFSLAAAEAGGASLRERLDAQAHFSELRVRTEPTAGAPQATEWLLRAQACWDGNGRFAGYLGVAQRCAEPVRQAMDPAAWLHALPGPAWLIAESGPAATDQAMAILRLQAVNAAAQALMGCNAESLLGRAWSDCVAMLPAELREALDKKQSQQGMNYSQGWLKLSRFSVASADGSPPRFFALLCLWPQMAAAEPDRSEHESFSYTVSHDLRAPLRVVEGFARILKEDYGRLLDRVGNDHLDRVMSAAARMNAMIDALLSLSQLSAQPLARQPVNLSQIASFVADELRRSAPDRVVHLQIQPHLTAQGDPTLLRMLLENLLGNAWKYSGKCEAAQISFSAQDDGKQIVYVVTDNGAGFDMRFAERLFGVFQRLHSASDFQGNGVGLASVRRIVRRHGGDIWAESEVGRGARFYFTLLG
jgi:signal transduction histidine kinase